MNNMKTEIAISLQKVTKEYSFGKKKYLALKGINLEITKGEFVSIVGKSGSGKSTLLNLIGGIDKPTEGKIFINGKLINNLSENQLSSLRGENIGFIFQFFQLMPTLTILENILLPMDYSKKIPKNQRQERAKILLDKVGILNHADKFPSELSGGEQQRVAIARALSNDPSIILADEPTGNLDTKTTEDIFGILKNLVRENKNVIMVTHNDDLAKRSERIIKIQDGLIL